MVHFYVFIFDLLEMSLKTNPLKMYVFNGIVFIVLRIVKA